MLFLHQHPLHIEAVKLSFHSAMLDFVSKRIDNVTTAGTPIAQRLQQLFDNIINPRLDQILTGKPGELIDIHDEISPYFSNSDELKAGVKYVFSYELFIKKAKNRYDAYDLATSLGIRTCPYCNINYTQTVITSKGKKLTRPQFDHYFDKDRYPLLAVSFYNLIPSCSTCNATIKGRAPMNLQYHIHPYLDNVSSQFRFSYEHSANDPFGLTIKLVTSPNSKEENTAKFFSLEDLYGAYTSELSDLIKVRNYFSDKYLSLLQSQLLANLQITQEEMYRIVFGAEYDVVNFLNRPFSKFKSDILKELGII